MGKEGSLEDRYYLSCYLANCTCAEHRQPALSASFGGRSALVALFQDADARICNGIISILRGKSANTTSLPE
jgi:hypothetical protein